MLQNRLAELREARKNGDNGFTLIELLVVVVIIGILIAIAIPLYLNYEKGAADKSAQSDVRGAISTLELCNSANGSYPASVAAGTVVNCTGQTIKTSSGTTLTYFTNAVNVPTTGTAANTAYIIEGTNSNGSGALYCYSSVNGGSVAKVTSAVLTAYPSTGACPS